MNPKPPRGAFRRSGIAALAASLGALLAFSPARAQVGSLTPAPDIEPGAFFFSIPLPLLGEYPLLVRPAGPLVGAPVTASPQAPVFRPPSFFSAPLPTGSGARALGFSGAFVSIADDATAASWNPAGLVHLARPEISGVWRWHRVENENRSDDPSFTPEDASYDSTGLNYLSAAWPLRLRGGWTNRIAVLSLNLQESYDFRQPFVSRVESVRKSSSSATLSRSYEQSDRRTLTFPQAEVFVNSTVRTRASSSTRQSTNTELTSSSTFEQEGVIEAFTPALGLEITPVFSVGAALNLHHDRDWTGSPIRTRTDTRFVSTSRTRLETVRSRVTDGHWLSSGLLHIDTGFFNFDLPLPVDEGDIPAFSEEYRAVRNVERRIEADWLETAELDNLRGFNATLGALWEPKAWISLGASLDLPWTSSAGQTVRRTRTTRTYDRATGGRLIDARTEQTVDSAEVEFDFPAFLNAGVTLKPHPHFYAALNANQSRWSDFAFRGPDGRSLNPLDGRPSEESPLRDTTSIHAGAEWLLVFRHREIPLRAGYAWEQRPALGEPDSYRGFSVGSGIALGRGPKKWILDLAYSRMAADDVQTILPGQAGFHTDTSQEQFYISLIRHL